MSDAFDKTLDQLQVGEVAEILSVSGSLADHLIHLGFLEGREVQVSHAAPFGGDPVVYWIQGGWVALRKNEARQIGVKFK